MVSNPATCAELLALDDRLLLRVATFCSMSMTAEGRGVLDDAERVALLYTVTAHKHPYPNLNPNPNCWWTMPSGSRCCTR